MTSLDEVLQQVTKTATCWWWEGGIDKRTGYGQFTLKNRRYKAHRAAFELTNGPIPKGLVVMHECDHKRCIRPDHLKLGTALENAQDAVKRGLYCRGESHLSSKLTKAEVIEIRRNADGLGKRRLAQRYGVGPSTIQDIRRGVTWKEIRP